MRSICGFNFGFGNSMFLGSGIFMFIFWVLVAISIVSIFRNVFIRRVGNFRGNNDENFMEMLKKRYVNGEITKEEYQEIKRKLRD